MEALSTTTVQRGHQATLDPIIAPALSRRVAMKYFFCKLVPPRATFAQDMTAAERDVMGLHVAYWQDLMHRQKALAFGPVAEALPMPRLISPLVTP